MPKDLIISIETSGRVGSAAVSRGPELVSETTFSGFMRHSAELFVVLEDLLKQAKATADEIQYCYITAGPGSFTGLRIAVTTAKMLHFSQDIRIIAADTMDVIAENAPATDPPSGRQPASIATILDAKKGFFYTSVFDRSETGWEKCFDTQIMTADQLLSWLETHGKQHVGLLGEGLLYYAKQFEAPFTFVMDESTWPAKAAGLLQVGHRMAAQGLFADPMTLTPTYIAQPDAVAKRQQPNPLNR